ncbi:MAG TPA: hypothetical protein VF041_00340 [Gemmatimonadaceae bacterium]
MHRGGRWVVGLALVIGACGGDDYANAARGRGLREAELPAAERAAVYEAAVRAAFTQGPSLSLLLYPELLPRESGYGKGAPVPGDVARALRSASVVRGTCGPFPDEERRSAPRCQASMAGYVVRFSPVLAMGRDSVQVYLQAQRYDLPAGPPHQPFAFERAYQLVRRNGEWRVVREGRVAMREWGTGNRES